MKDSGYAVSFHPFKVLLHDIWASGRVKLGIGIAGSILHWNARFVQIGIVVFVRRGIKINPDLVDGWMRVVGRAVEPMLPSVDRGAVAGEGEPSLVAADDLIGECCLFLRSVCERENDFKS